MHDPTKIEILRFDMSFGRVVRDGISVDVARLSPDLNFYVRASLIWVLAIWIARVEANIVVRILAPYGTATVIAHR